MELQISLDAPGDRTARIYLALREAVLDGRLACGDRVPATRDLAHQLDVSRGTVTAAYDRLVAEGFLESRTGSGTFVGQVPLARPVSRSRRARVGVVQPLPVWAASQSRTGSPNPARHPGGLAAPTSPARSAPGGARGRGFRGTEYDLSVGVPDAQLFPLEVWRRLVSGQLRRTRLDDSTYAPAGHQRLQGEIARHVGLSRSVVASADDIVVTAGAQQALDLVARVLVEPGAIVALEDPGYTAAQRLFETHRAVVRGVPVDGEGLVVDAIPTGARLVYVTPSHQFPTGAAMSLSRRAALLEWAIRHDGVIVEDDYDSEYRFSDRPVEPLQSLDRDGRVIYVGSFSKSLLPALRVGYLVPPRSLDAALREAKRVTVWEGDSVTQGALADFIAEGHHAAHVRRASRVYRERREVLLAGLDEQLGDVVELVPSVAGLHVCAMFRDQSVSDVDVVAEASRLGVTVEGLSVRYHEQPARQGLLMGIGRVTTDGLPVAIARLAEALRA